MIGHLPELIIILGLALIVFGPEKLPEVAANAGRIVREARQILDDAMNQHDTEVDDDFSTYYYDSMARSGEEEEEEPYEQDDVHIPTAEEYASYDAAYEMPDMQEAAAAESGADSSAGDEAPHEPPLSASK